MICSCSQLNFVPITTRSLNAQSVSSITGSSGVAHTRFQARMKNLKLTVEVGKMSGTEGIPLWDSVTHPLANALEFAFGCHHTKLSRVFTIDGHSYKVCCECGATFDYSLRTMSITHHRRLLAALKRLRAQRRWRKISRPTPSA